MQSYTLSQSFIGHNQDVKAISIGPESQLLSASRDGTVRSWNISKESNIKSNIYSMHIGHVNSLTFIKCSEKYPHGLIVSSGQDKFIAVYDPYKSTEPDYMLIGHKENVCVLHATEDCMIISGSWDKTAKIWRDWQCAYTLYGHTAAVWAAIIVDENRFLTVSLGSADKTIILWHKDVKTILFEGHTDCVRSLCKISDSEFASCGNDGVIYIWSFSGEKIQKIVDGSSFIYSISVLSTKEIVSSGEDRSVKIWKNGECIQTIMHPAVSIWSVFVLKNDDIVTGGSDGIVRIFTKNKERIASKEEIDEFNKDVASHKISNNSMNYIDKEKLPGLEALQKQGKKDQVIMIKANNLVEAYQWDMSKMTWNKVGEVVDVASPSQKQFYNGQKYDYVFDVDISEDSPPLKLPYNVNQNPYEVAYQFIKHNELPMEYLDKIAQFIQKNTEAIKIERQESFVDPYSTGRYIPGCINSENSNSFSKKVLPHTTFLSFKQANISALARKCLEFNSGFLESGYKNISLNPDEISALKIIVEYLKTSENKSLVQNIELVSLDLATKLSNIWPYDKRFPGLDMLRILCGIFEEIGSYKYSTKSIIDIIIDGGFSDVSSNFSKKIIENNIMLSLKALVNLFEKDSGKEILNKEFEKIITKISGIYNDLTARDAKIALSTLYLNFSIFFYQLSSVQNALSILSPILEILSEDSDSECIYRTMVALGTTLYTLKNLKKITYKVLTIIQKCKNKFRESRIELLVKEILEILQSQK
ncbi:uncharacterized protein T551_02338 [Pneumocystis jirovecii RU7]|uniref:Phospholipase A-2-activating protein n=1 Tax=Pneumocystis jirovecii (strain RU7) TaxID=1408657 RepID=A0A0W4ZL27_PNEJ7|nr:uncharacterized protein T551_02338 [Pneumocystis jirovecii RU7]KTW29064.1 hypothetical protein T551_02338 [Pneumocystis jirovecii RU7]